MTDSNNHQEATSVQASNRIKRTSKGRFASGVSGNPGGRPKTDEDLLNLFKGKVPHCIDKLFYWLDSDNPKASLTAINIILDRALGKADGKWSLDVIESRKTYW
jgi:hypothetical protein